MKKRVKVFIVVSTIYAGELEIDDDPASTEENWEAISINVARQLDTDYIRQNFTPVSTFVYRADYGGVVEQEKVDETD